MTCKGTGVVTIGTYSIGPVGPGGQDVQLPETESCKGCPDCKDTTSDVEKTVKSKCKSGHKVKEECCCWTDLDVYPGDTRRGCCCGDPKLTIQHTSL